MSLSACCISRRTAIARSSSARGEVVGSVGFAPCLAPFGLLPSFEPSPQFTPEVGLFWALVPQHRGKGYATEAALAMVGYAFRYLRLWRIGATTENDNARSINVMRRLDMRIERNPRAEPDWFQTVGILENRAGSGEPEDVR